MIILTPLNSRHEDDSGLGKIPLNSPAFHHVCVFVLIEMLLIFDDIDYAAWADRDVRSPNDFCPGIFQMNVVAFNRLCRQNIDFGQNRPYEFAEKTDYSRLLNPDRATADFFGLAWRVQLNVDLSGI